MDDMRVEITVDNTEKFKARLAEAVENALEAVGMHLEGEAKEELSNSPKRIDTGLLRNSITYAISGQRPAITTYRADHADEKGVVGSGEYTGNAPEETKGKAVYVGSNVEYAAYVHEGTIKMDPNRFLKNAFDKNRGQIEDFIKKELKKVEDGL